MMSFTAETPTAKCFPAASTTTYACRSLSPVSAISNNFVRSRARGLHRANAPHLE